MKSGALVLAVLGACAAGNAWAQTASVSAASLFADGYEVKIITDISAEEQKSIWPNDPVNPYLLITLQKGNSIATCSVATANWVSLADTTMTNATLCRKR